MHIFKKLYTLYSIQNPVYSPLAILQTHCWYKELSRTAKDRRADSLGFAEAIVTYYNKRSRFELSMEKLYSHKNKKNGEAAESAILSDESEPETSDEGFTEFDQMTIGEAINQ